MDILNNMKSILKYSFSFLIIAVLSTFATSVASAKTITQSNSLISEDMLNYFNNIYEREDYKNYLLVNEYVSNGSYNSINYYYMCLTNDIIDTSDTLNVVSSCDKIYRVYRSNSSYVLENYHDNSLSISNSIYYAENGKKYYIEKLLIGLNIGVLTFYLSYVILKIFRS